MSDAPKKKVYVETSVVSYLTARPTRDIVSMAHQIETRSWWELANDTLDLYSSTAVLKEAQRGDPAAAAERVSILMRIGRLEITEPALALADKMLDAAAVPRRYYDDALHIAIAATAGMEYLVTWNCKHIANPETMPLVGKVCEKAGLACPILCTPEQMKGVMS